MLGLPGRLRRGFTLMELLVIIAIIGVMAGTAVLSIRGGQSAARVKGATRDVFATIRQARSQAIVTQKPVVVTYSTESVDGECVAKIEMTSAELFTAPVDESKIQALTGPARRRTSAAGAAKTGDADASSLIQDVLFAPIGEDVVRGVRLKAVEGEEEAEGETRATRASMFSNVDFLTRQYNRMRGVTSSDDAAKKKDESAETGGKDAKDGSSADEMPEPLSVVWDTNGRVNKAHQIWIYADGKRPEEGLMIRIDRFGAAKVLSGDGREEDER